MYGQIKKNSKFLESYCDLIADSLSGRALFEVLIQVNVAQLWMCGRVSKMNVKLEYSAFHLVKCLYHKVCTNCMFITLWI